MISFLWALGLGVFIWLGALAIGISSLTSFVVALLAGAGIFLYVRLYGQDPPGRAR